MPKTLQLAFDSHTLNVRDFFLHLLPLVLMIGLQAWMLYLTQTPNKRFSLSRLFIKQETTYTISPDSPSLELILSKPQPSQEQLDQMFAAYGNYYGVSPKTLRHIAYCESRFIPTAINGRHVGLYQFNPITWSATRERMSHDPNPDLRYDAEESIKTAAFKISNGGIRAWPYCGRNFFHGS